MNPLRVATNAVDWVLEGALDNCHDDEITVRRTLTTAWVGVSLVTPLWGVVYILYGEVLSGLIPTVYAFVTYLSLYCRRRFGGFEWIRVSQLVFHLLLPFFLMWSLGGFGPSSAVLIWALLAPLSSVWAARANEAWFVLASFAALTIFSAFIDSSLPATNNLPPWLVIGFYAGNFLAMSVIIFALLIYFVGLQSSAIAVLRRNRELEAVYLQQEVSLRQSDKLATIGKLSAGLAHELNNPAAAVQQATKGLSTMLMGPDHIRAEVEALGLTGNEAATLTAFADRIGDRVAHPDFIDPLERSDRESQVQDLLDQADVEDGWELAPALVGLGLDAADIERLVADIDPARLGSALSLISGQFQRQGLLGSLDESTRRITEIVGALKSYTHLDQAPHQLIDIHEGLDSTLVMLQNRLKVGIEVIRDYDHSLPMIDAHGSELNQVWTNILDNAIDAMGGEGVITLVTGRSGDRVKVEIGDDGPGIPADLIDTIFDPFVTTKAPGEGTGLGLNISHSIVTQKHKGEISVASEPGRTVFTVCLPIGAADDTDPVAIGQSVTKGTDKWPNLSS